MKTNQMQVLLGIVCAAGALEMASPASGATMTYNYTDSGLDGSAWILMKYTPTTATVTWEDTFNYVNNGAYFGFQRNALAPASSSSGYRGALAWTAPENQVVTNVSFQYWTSLGASDWAPVMYELARGETLAANTDIKVTFPDSPDITSRDLPYAVADNIQGLGLGFDTIHGAYNGWAMYYRNVIITTTIIPEPMTAGLLLLGGACLACVRRRHDAGA